MIEKLFLGKWLVKCPAVVQHIYLLFTVLVSFVIFSVEKLSDLGTYVGGLFGVGGIPLFDERMLYIADSFAVVFILCIVASLPYPKMLWNRFSETKYGSVVRAIADPVVIVAMLLVSTALLVDGSFNPFLYVLCRNFRFRSRNCCYHWRYYDCGNGRAGL